MKTISLVAALLLVAACGAQAQGMSMPKPTTPAASSPPSALALVDAQVQKVDTKKGLLVLKHGEIPNLGMPAMTMGFDVANAKMLKGLKQGDKVRFQAEMIGGKATVTELKPAR